MKLVQVSVILFATAGLLPADDKKGGKDAPAKWDGVWVVESIVSDGQKVPADEVKKLTAVIKGDRYTIRRDGEVIEEGTSKTDVTKAPHAIEITASSGRNKGVTMYGIFEAGKDTIKAHVGKERPKDFTPKEGTVLIVYKRKADK